MLKDAVSVKFRKPVGVSGKMGRHPVQNDSHADLVQLVHQVHEILGHAVSGGRRIVSRHLIAPGAVEGMLQNPHQLHMGVFHVLQIFHQPIRKLTVIIESLLAVGMLHKRSHMALVDSHRQFVHILLVPSFHPCIVLPLEALQIRDDRRGARTVLRMVGKRVGLVELPAVLSRNQKLVHGPRFHAGKKQAPDSHRPQLLHGSGLLVPSVKAPDHIYLPCIGRPNSEIDPFLPVLA